MHHPICIQFEARGFIIISMAFKHAPNRKRLKFGLQSLASDPRVRLRIGSGSLQDLFRIGSHIASGSGQKGGSGAGACRMREKPSAAGPDR